MLRIHRSSSEQMVFTLSGRMDEEYIAELKALLSSEANGRPIVLDRKDVTSAGPDAVSFLEQCEADGITLGRQGPARGEDIEHADDA
jgi:hypothetical protein